MTKPITKIKKLWEDKTGVSPIIAVILMVAITVVLAATIYVWVSGFGGGGTGAPSMAMTDDRADDLLRVSSADSDIKWTDISVQCAQAGVTKADVTTIGDGGTTTAYVQAGDTLSYADGSGTFDITLIYTPDNAEIGTWTVTNN
jgi:flagellin-like protein